MKLACFFDALHLRPGRKNQFLKALGVLCTVVLSLDVCGQEERWSDRLEFVEGSVFSHSVSLPLRASNQLIGLNRLPGAQIGVGVQLLRPRARLAGHYTLSLAGYHQPDLHYGFELEHAVRFQYRPLPWLALEGGGGLAYLRTFEDAPVYKLENGQYKQVRDWGRSQLNASLHAGLAVPISHRWSVFTHYKVITQAPFSRKAGVLFIVHNRMALGLRLNLQHT